LKRPCQICEGIYGKAHVVEEVNGQLVWEEIPSKRDPGPGAVVKAAKAAGEADAFDRDLGPAPEPETEDDGGDGEPEEEAPAEPEALAPVPTPAPEAAPAKRRGRPPGSKNRPPEPIVVAPELEPETESEANPALALALPAVPAPAAPRSLTLIVNCAVFSVETKLLSLERLFQQYGALCAQAYAVPTYYNVGSLKRRDSMAACAASIAALNNGATIMGRMDTKDMVNFVAALRPFCTTYIEGIGTA
jgi:hypothetical protein